MKRTSVPTCFAMLLLPMTVVAAPEGARCGTGTLLDVQVNVETIQTGTTEHGRENVKKNGKKEYDRYSTSYAYKQTTYTVTVRLDDMVYDAQSESIFGLGFKPTLLVVNDPIPVCLRGNTLALMRPDGKEYRTHILRTARVPAGP